MWRVEDSSKKIGIQSDRLEFETHHESKQWLAKFLPVVTRVVYPVTVILISWLLHKFDGLLQTLQGWATAVLHRAGVTTLLILATPHCSGGRHQAHITINSLTIFWSQLLMSLQCSHVVSSPICGHLHRLRLTTAIMAPLPVFTSRAINGKTSWMSALCVCCVPVHHPMTLPGRGGERTAPWPQQQQQAGRVQVSNQRCSHREWTAHARAGPSSDCRLERGGLNCDGDVLLFWFRLTK